MRKYIVVEKHIGRTPLGEILDLKKRDIALAHVPLTYAGRLDPMATGKLLVLIGEECKKRKKYDALDKEYVFEILFGYTTDSGDVLGMPTAHMSPKDITASEVDRTLKSIIGPISLPYPAFSSKTVQGKPLFEYAHAGTIDDIEVPVKVGIVYSCQLLSLRRIQGQELIGDIKKSLATLTVSENTGTVNADFRREEIMDTWGNVVRNESSYVIGTVKVIVSSGVYIRSLAPLIAMTLGEGGVAYSIHRTRIGIFKSIVKGWGIWIRTYS